MLLMGHALTSEHGLRLCYNIGLFGGFFIPDPLPQYVALSPSLSADMYDLQAEYTVVMIDGRFPIEEMFTTTPLFFPTIFGRTIAHISVAARQFIANMSL